MIGIVMSHEIDKGRDKSKKNDKSILSKTQTWVNRLNFSNILPNDDFAESNFNDRKPANSIDDVAVITLDINGCIISWGLAAEKITGYDFSEAGGLHYTFLLANDTDENYLKQAYEDDVFEAHGLFRKKNQNPFRAKAVYSCIKNASSEPVAYTLIIKDEFSIQHFPVESVMNEVVNAVIITDARLEKPGPCILYVNPQFTRMTGYKPSEIIGKTPRILQGIKTDRHVLKDIKQKLNQGLPYAGKIINYHKDGSEFYLHLNISPVRDGNSNITHFLSIQRNLTEEIQKEQDLIKREEQFRLLAENTEDIVSLHRKDGSYIYCSPAVERTLGYKPGEIIGRSPFDFFHPSDVAKGKLEFELLLISRMVSTHVFRMRHHNGNFRWMEAKVKPVLDERDNIRHFVVASRDITEEKEAKKELKLQRAYFKQLFESSPEGVVMLDNMDRIVNANQSFQELFQYELAELKGRNINELIVPDQNSVENTKTLYKAVGHNSHHIEAIRKRKDGSLVDVSIVGAPIEHNDKLVGVYGIYRDISLQKRDEYTVKQSLKEKEVLLQEIHHRVKNNMQVISSLHNLQARQIKDDKTLAIFKECQNRVQAMALIHDQLYQTKDLSGIDFGSYLQDLLHQLFASLGRKGITYSVKSDPVSFNVNQAVPCGLIVNELVTNSMKHAFEGGRNGEIEVNLSDTKDDFILLEVRDNGIGFPHNVDFRKTSTSLGLQLVNGLVGQIRGQIKLSTENETRFSIRLPKE